MKKDDTELERLKKFCIVVLDFIAESATPGVVARDQFVRALEDASSVRGMRDATRDMIEWGGALPPGQIRELDSRLVAFGLPTFSLMRAKRGREVSRVLARGRIDSEEEYRLLTSVVSDLDSPEHGTGDRALAERLLGEFTQQRR
jgi:hypothetical protein